MITLVFLGPQIKIDCGVNQNLQSNSLHYQTLRVQKMSRALHGDEQMMAFVGQPTVTIIIVLLHSNGQPDIMLQCKSMKLRAKDCSA